MEEGLNQSTQTEPIKKKSKWWIWLIIIVGIIVVIFIIIAPFVVWKEVSDTVQEGSDILKSKTGCFGISLKIIETDMVLNKI
jgi:flagellar basal body-associated protein FliL